MNEDVKIKVFASGKRQKSYDATDEKKISQVFREQVLPSTKRDYHSVNVKVKRNQDNNPEYMIAYMLRQDTYTADVVKIKVDEQFDVKEIVENYNDQEDYDDEDSMQSNLDYADEAYDFVVATPVPEIPTALQAIDFIYNIATSSGYMVKKLIGADATVENYKHYLQLNLKGFVNVGHGYPEGIILDDGRLRYTWFQGLVNRPLHPAVIYFNSCQVFNPPLLPEVMNSGARTFIGGIINLLIGMSEEVCKAFWDSIITKKTQMGAALSAAELTHYPTSGAHGIAGDHGLFRADKLVGILAVNNRFVCANNGGGADLISNRTWIREWETFRLYQLTTDKIALQAHNMNYVCAEGGGGCELLANRNKIDIWETFEVSKQAGERVSFKAHNGQFVCAEDGGISHLMANRWNMSAWETFELIPLRHIGLIAANGKYVCAENGGGRELIANREWLRSWETFMLAEVGSDEIALQSYSGNYICAENEGALPLVANRNWIRTWEIFKMKTLGDGKVALRACNGKYVTVNDSGILIADKSRVGSNETFTLVEIDGNLSLELSARKEELEIAHA